MHNRLQAGIYYKGKVYNMISLLVHFLWWINHVNIKKKNTYNNACYGLSHDSLAYLFIYF
jgi:hypothetical protein